MPVTRFVRLRPAEWPAAPAWRYLRLISVAPFLRGEPLPPSDPFTHLRVDESFHPVHQLRDIEVE